MIILHTITKSRTTYNVYMGSHENKYIFNIVESNQPKPSGGYPNLNYICEVKGIDYKDIKSIKFKAEQIMGKNK